MSDESDDHIVGSGGYVCGNTEVGTWYFVYMRYAFVQMHMLPHVDG